MDIMDQIIQEYLEDLHKNVKYKIVYFIED